MMKVWSIQKKRSGRQSQKEGVYQPDFQKSDYLKELPKQTSLYYMLPDAFHVENQAALPGLVFSFLASNSQNQIYCLGDINAFYQFIQTRRAAILSLWRNLCRGEITPSIFPSYIIQAHAPSIHAQDVKGIYEMFDLERWRSKAAAPAGTVKALFASYSAPYRVFI